MKLIICNTLLAISFCLIILLMGCMSNISIRDVSQEAPYLNMIGQKYELLTNCYIAEPIKCSGAHFVIIPCGVLDVPNELYNTNIGKIYGNYKLIAALPKGTFFFLEQVMVMYVYENITLQFHIFKIQLNCSGHSLICDGTYIADEKNPSFFKEQYTKPLMVLSFPNKLEKKQDD